LAHQTYLRNRGLESSVMEAAAIELDGQYRALREGAGLVERSDRGKLLVRGSEALDYLQGQLTNDVEALGPGDGCYAALLDRKGHMQGDMRVAVLAPEEIWLDTEPEALPAVTGHLGMYKVGRDVEIEDVTAERAILSVIGPAASEFAIGGPAGPEYSHRETEIAGFGCCVISTDLGVDIVCGASAAAGLGRSLTSAGIVEVTEDAAEIVRVESGRPRFGREMTTRTIPQEAGINDRAVSFTKGCYIGQETVARLHYKGKPNRHLRGLRSEARLEAHTPITLGDREVGAVGTAVLSPALGPIALAIVRREAEPGTTVAAGGDMTAEVVELPF
jgi:folate-binding protein YgfZ